MELVSPKTGHAVSATTAAVQTDDTIAESMARHAAIELIEVD